MPSLNEWVGSLLCELLPGWVVCGAELQSVGWQFAKTAEVGRARMRMLPPREPWPCLEG